MNAQADIPTWIMALIAAGFFGGLGVAAFLLHERRRRGFEALARRRGLTFHEIAPRSVRLPEDFIREVESAFIVGSAIRRALEIERDGGRVFVCELLRYRARSGGGERGHYGLNVAMIEGEGVDIPEFALDPEKLRHKLADLKSGGDIDFGDSPGFSSRHVLRGSHEAAIRDWFTPERRAFFEQHPGWHVRGYGSRLVLFRRAGLLQWAAFRPASAERLLDAAIDFQTLLDSSD
jgi:hypothetical protein